MAAEGVAAWCDDWLMEQLKAQGALLVVRDVMWLSNSRIVLWRGAAHLPLRLHFTPRGLGIGLAASGAMLALPHDVQLCMHVSQSTEGLSQQVGYTNAVTPIKTTHPGHRGSCREPLFSSRPAMTAAGAAGAPPPKNSTRTAAHERLH